MTGNVPTAVRSVPAEPVTESFPWFAGQEAIPTQRVLPDQLAPAAAPIPVQVAAPIPVELPVQAAAPIPVELPVRAAAPIPVQHPVQPAAPIPSCLELWRAPAPARHTYSQTSGAARKRLRALASPCLAAAGGSR